jgi:hypothetical protein
MRRRLPAALLVLSTMPLRGTDIPKGPPQSFEVTSTERFTLAPGATIRLEHSYGYLTVEGWDEPEIEIAVTKSSDRFEDPDWRMKAAQFFDQVRVVTERRSDKELLVSTRLPHRTPFLITSVLPSGSTIVTSPVPPNNKRGITVEYRIRAPRNSRLVVHHDNGYVWVSDLTGDLDLHSHTGDMIALLPDPGPYALDARTRFGRIASDIPCKSTNPFLMGGHLSCQAPASAPQVRLRMGRGSITIKNGPASRR